MESGEEFPLIEEPKVEPLAKLDLSRWKGSFKGSLAEFGYESVDDYINDVRGPVPAALTWVQPDATESCGHCLTIN